MALTDAEYQARIAELKSRTAEIQLEPELRSKLHRIITATFENYDELDPYILDMDKETIDQHAKLLASPDEAIHVSQNDMFDIEKICLCAERWVEDLGDINMTSAEIGAIAKKVITFRKQIFTET